MARAGIVNRLATVLDARAASCHRIWSLTLEIIGDRVTLCAVGLVGRQMIGFAELKSAVLPMETHEVANFYDVFDLLMTIVAVVRDQNDVMKTLQSQHREYRFAKCKPSYVPWL